MGNLKVALMTAVGVVMFWFCTANADDDVRWVSPTGDDAKDGLAKTTADELKVGGEIGRHLDLTVRKVLRHTDVERDFLRFFRNRVPSEGRLRDCEQAGGPYRGFVGYGMFLDGVVKACARGIGGAELRAFKDKALADLIATQGKDGSISVFTSIPKGNIVWDHRAVWDNHESAYILQALANDYLAFGTRTSREAAVRLADHMMEREEGLNIGCETAFVLVGQATKDPKYRAWLERQFRIAAGPDEYGPLVGGLVHVYKTIARSVAQLDYALAYGQTGNAALTAPAREVMGRLLGPYSSVTGSCTTNDGNPDWGELWGVSQHGVGKWGETCASAYAMRLATRLQAIDPSPVYGDYIERVLYNAFFAAQSEDGVKCRYFVPFDEPGEWWPRDTYCCPNNFRRWMFELPDAVILKTAKGVAVNLYTEATYRTDGLTLEMKTRYPKDGEVEIVTETKRPLELKLRIPRWSEEPDAGLWRIVRLGVGRQVTKLAFRLRDRLVRGTGEQSGKVALVRGPIVFGLDKDGKRVRFSDPRRVRTYFVPPADAKTVPDELFP